MVKKYGFYSWYWRILAAIIFLSACSAFNVQAQDVGTANVPVAGNTIDYAGQPVVDTDMDGLTDAGENEMFMTDPARVDTDADGFWDAVEVIGGTDPLDASSNINNQESSIGGRLGAQAKETPWLWYVIRSSGILAFGFIYLSFFFGFGMRLPWLKKLLWPVDFMAAHRWVSVQALLLMFVHAITPLFDKHFKISLLEILVPFASSYGRYYMAAGTIGMYLLAILVATSLLRKRIPVMFWRVLHYFYIVVYVAVVYHAIYLGTDFANQWVANLVYLASGSLLVMALLNMKAKLASNAMKKRDLIQAPVKG